MEKNMDNNIIAPLYHRRARRNNYCEQLDPENKQNFDKILTLPAMVKHMYILGMSGSGKTEIFKLLVIRFYLERDNNIIVIDSSGDLSQQIAKGHL